MPITTPIVAWGSLDYIATRSSLVKCSTIAADTDYANVGGIVSATPDGKAPHVSIQIVRASAQDTALAPQLEVACVMRDLPESFAIK